MIEPRVIPRSEHTLSRRDVDPDALKVLYRLRQADHIAYLVGGSVRDLLLGRRPKDFDIGTSAHPYQVKKLFRNCWIIGRRFRLAHVKFGTKVIEVATFRRQVPPGEEVAQDGVPAGVPRADEDLLHRDNTFGTPEEDAFRRDLTINALFYDIATFSVIDYTGGLDDLRARVVRCIGDPALRFQEDPVRMLRAIAMAARLDFVVDKPIADAIKILRHEIARSSPPRLLEEYYKILRAGAAEKTFRGLASAGLLEPISAELHAGADEPLWRALANVDAYRARFDSTPSTFTNGVLLGSLLVPLGLAPQLGRQPMREPDEGRAHEGKQDGKSGTHEGRKDGKGGDGGDDGKEAGKKPGKNRRPILPRLGELPLARRDVEHLRHLLSLQRRLQDTSASPRTKRALTQRSIFADALTWLEIHGGAPELVEHWKGILAERSETADGTAPAEDTPPVKRRRRRRRHRSRPAGDQ